MNQIRYSSRPIAIDFFAGAGGLSLGLEQAGFDVVLAVDRDGYHVATHERNFPNGRAICASVANLTGASIRELLGTDREIDLVAGGPPCQGFSHMGTRDLLDPRNTLVDEFVKRVAELQPRAVLMENVPGMQTGATAEIFNRAMTKLKKSGYTITTPVRTVNALDFGVPQKRERLFVLAIRSDIGTVAEYPKALPEGQPERPNVGEAIAGLPLVASNANLFDTDTAPYPAPSPELHSYVRVARGLERDPSDYSYPRGWNAAQCTASKAVRHRPEVAALYGAAAHGTMVPGHKLPKLDPKGYAPTLRAGSESEHGSFTAPRPVHPFEARCITAREAARLHGYPDWFRFYPGSWHAYRQIGNSVVPQVARAMGLALMKALGYVPIKPTDVLPLSDQFALPDDRPKQHRRIVQTDEWPKIVEHLVRNALDAKGRLTKPDFSIADVEAAYVATGAKMPRSPARRFLQDIKRSRNIRKLLAPAHSKSLSICEGGIDGFYGRFVPLGTPGTLEDRDAITLSATEISSAIPVTKRNGSLLNGELTSYLASAPVRLALFHGGKLFIEAEGEDDGKSGLRFKVVLDGRCLNKGMVLLTDGALPTISQLTVALTRSGQKRALVMAPITTRHFAVVMAGLKGGRVVERAKKVFEVRG